MRIEFRGDNRSDAVTAGTQHNAYLAANLAFNDGPQAAAERYMDVLAIPAAFMAIARHSHVQPQWQRYLSGYWTFRNFRPSWVGP